MIINLVGILIIILEDHNGKKVVKRLTTSNGLKLMVNYDILKEKMLLSFSIAKTYLIGNKIWHKLGLLVVA